MKERYEFSELEIFFFEDADVVTDSGGTKGGSNELKPINPVKEP